jgi:hypothetical protein
MPVPDIIQSDPTNEQQDQQSNLELYRQLYGSRTFQYDAVSGAQIKVQLGDDVILDDCTAIQYTLTQAKKPVYGYHSQLFDAVAPGIVIVHGRLWLNFVHQGYLRVLIEGFKSGRDLLSGIQENIREENPTPPNTTEDLIAFVQKENRQVLSTLSASDKIKLRPDLKQPVDIYINYGDRTEFGNAIPLKVIYQVHFIGEGQDNQISGQPIQEWYEFIARQVT